MNKFSIGNGSLLMKSVCLAIVLMLAGSLLASGVMGFDNCGMQCCCQSGISHMQPSVAKKVQSPMGCCSGAAQPSCDIQSAKPFELPEIILASPIYELPRADGPADILAFENGFEQNSGHITAIQDLHPLYKSPPLYLQKLSFII